MGLAFKTEEIWKQAIAKQQWLCYGVCLLMLLLSYYQWSVFFAFNNSLEPPQKKLFPSAMVSGSKPMVLLSTSLFGQYISKDSAQDIKNSTLSLTVVGILYETQLRLSQVTIKDNQGKEETYRLGDKIPGDAVIKQINPQDIVVLFHGELQRLMLPTPRLTFEPQAKPLLEDK